METAIIGGSKSGINAAVLAAVRLAGVVEEPIRVPQGELGGCIACGHTAASHFSAGAWVGCVKGEPGMVFILVPATSAPQRRERKHTAGAVSLPAVAHETAPIVVEAPHQTRGFVQARYRSTLHHRAKVDRLGLSPTRAKVLKTIHAKGKAGILARQIRKEAKLPHGSVQQNLNWLRAHKFVSAEENAPG